jgi:hypothetical protein
LFASLLVHDQCITSRKHWQAAVAAHERHQARLADPSKFDQQDQRLSENVRRFVDNGKLKMPCLTRLGHSGMWRWCAGARVRGQIFCENCISWRAEMGCSDVQDFDEIWHYYPEEALTLMQLLSFCVDQTFQYLSLQMNFCSRASVPIKQAFNV